MRELQFQGYREGPYASDAVDVDFSQGRIRGRPTGSNLFTVPTGTCSALYHHAASGYFLAVIGSTLYRLTSGSSTSLVTGITAPARILEHGQKLVLVASNKVAIIDPNTWTASVVARPSKPSSVTASKTTWTQSDFTNVNNAGGATVTVGTNDIDIDDNTSDALIGAWAELYRTDAIGDYVGFLVIDVIGHDNELTGANITAINATSSNEVKAMGASAVPGDHGRLVLQVAGKGLKGVRVYVDKGLLKIQKAWRLVPDWKPYKYRVTMVDSNGWESEYTEVTVSGSAENEDLGWYAYLSMPSGTKRIYRQDALGYWRKVAETTNTTFTDTVPEEELGDRLVDILPPTGGTSAISWQSRLCIGSGNELYVSAPAEFNFSTWAGGDRLRFPSAIKALVDGGYSLLVGCEDGWYEVNGLPGAWTVKFLGLHAPENTYSSRLPVVSAGRTLYVNMERIATYRYVVDSAQAGEYLIVVTNSEWLVFTNGRWARWTLPATAVCSVASQGNNACFAYVADGYLKTVAMPSSNREAFSISQKFPLSERGQLRWIHVDGSGTCTVYVAGQSFASGNLPITSDWKRGESWVLDLQLAATGEVYRTLVDIEALQVRR